MSELGRLIRKIRKRQGKTMAEFGEQLNTTAATISRYEAGKFVPDRSALLKLLGVAQGEERRALLRALGSVEPDRLDLKEKDLARDLEIARAEMERVLKEDRSAPETRRWMLGLALQIGRHPEIPLWLPTIMSLWQRYYTNPRMASLIAELGEKMIARIRDEEVRWELQAPNDAPQRVMIRCPEKGLPVFTGVTVTGREFAVGTFSRMEVFCPHCHITHTWNKPDAFLEGR